MSRKTPTRSELALLNPLESFAYRFAALMAGPLKWLGSFYLTHVGSNLVRVCVSRRFHIHGLERLEHLDKNARILMVANHRSFFDFFIIAHILFRHSRLSHRVFFPVRSTFFYESALGVVINTGMAAMCMFPPIVRDDGRKGWNRFAVERVLYELSLPGTIIGVHPEGKRGKGEDPYAFLPAQPGCGRMALESDCLVLPVFIFGVGNNVKAETLTNFRDPKSAPIDVYFGAPLDMSDLRRGPSNREAWLRASRRCMDGVAALAEEQRKHRTGPGTSSGAPMRTAAR